MTRFSRVADCQLTHAGQQSFVVMAFYKGLYYYITILYVFVVSLLSTFLVCVIYMQIIDKFRHCELR